MTGALIEPRQERRVPRWRADAALAFVALGWGTTFVVVKAALAEISTIYFLFLRFSLAAVCMALLFLPAFRRAGSAAVLRGLRGGAVAGLFLWAGYMLQTFGLRYTAAGKSGFITGLYIVLVPILNAIVYRRLPQWAEIFGISAAGSGLVLLTLPTFELHMNRGDLLTVGCAVAFAFHLLIVGYYSRREQFEAVAFGQVAGSAVFSGLALGIEPLNVSWSASVVWGLVLTSVIATAFAFALQTWAQQYTTATRTAVIFSLEPVFAFLTAVSLGGEAPDRYAVMGGALILCGILLVELKPGSSR